jgi:hypothetical protein
MDKILDAIAEFALASYYHEAGIPADCQSVDDAHALLNGYNSDTCWVGAAETSGHNMGNTRAACMAWSAASSDFIGFNALEVAGVYSDIAGMTNDAAVLAELEELAEGERDTWHAIANRLGADADDADALEAWENVLQVILAREVSRA